MQFRKKISAPRISAGIFLLIIFLIPLLTFCWPKDSFLENENKNRAGFPPCNFYSILDGKFQSGFEKYLADSFPAHSAWIGLQTRIRLALGQREINGIYILENRLLPRICPPNEEHIRHSIDAISKFSGRFRGTTYLMLIPTAAEIYRSELPVGAPTIPEKAVIDEVYSRVKDVTAVDVYSSLSANRSSSLYYRNDHHWSSKGAYAGYSTLGSQLGYTAVPADLFNVEHASHSFRGSSYSRVIYSGPVADTIDLYSYPAGPAVESVSIFDGQEWSERDSLYFREYLDQKDKYAVFLGPDQPVITIRTNAPNAERLLIFGDSFARSLVPFLSLHYKEITLVDLRYLNRSFEHYVHLFRYDQALFCYSLKSFTEEDVIKFVNVEKSGLQPEE